MKMDNINDSFEIPKWINFVPENERVKAVERYNVLIAKRRDRRNKVKEIRERNKVDAEIIKKLYREINFRKYRLIDYMLLNYKITIAYTKTEKEFSDNKAIFRCYFSICSPKDSFSKRKSLELIFDRINKNDMNHGFNCMLTVKGDKYPQEMCDRLHERSIIGRFAEHSSMVETTGIPSSLKKGIKSLYFNYFYMNV